MLSSLDLHFFHVIATSKSLSAAAKKLNVTPPTVTQRLQNLESKLALKLVERDFRSSRLTVHGKKLASRCKSILDEIDLVANDLKADKYALSGLLTVLAPFGFGEKHIAPLIADFSQQYPKLNIKLLLSDHPDKENVPDADIVIYIGKLKSSSMRRILLSKNRRLICASPDYLAKHHAITHPEQLTIQNCIGLIENNEDSMLWNFTHKATQDTFNIRIQPKLVSNVADAIKVWALKGLGVIHRSEWDVAQELQQGSLQEILTDYQLPDADIVALLSESIETRSQRVNLFIEHIKSALKDYQKI